jgi:hypothetical protein
VLIIGCRGVLGTLTARAFAAAGWEVTGAARRPVAGQIKVDLDRRDSIIAALHGHDLVVNTVPHPELWPERIVLERGGLLINTSALPAAAGRALRAVAGHARGTVLMNAGLAPGVTNLVAAYLLHLHPEAHELEIVITLSSTAPRGPASAQFVRRGLTAVSRHRTVDVRLPAPFGERRCIGFGEGDAGWLGGVAEGRVVRVYICVYEPGPHRQLLELNKAGSIDSLPRSLIGSHTLSADGSAGREPVGHLIVAKRCGRRLDARTVQCRGDFRHAALSTVVFARALVEHDRIGGCVDPEEICSLSELEPKLHGAGVRIEPYAMGPSPAIEDERSLLGRR